MKQLFGFLAFVAIVVIVIGGFVGWCKNAYRFTQLDFEAPYKAEVVRGIGLFTPIGPIAGYFYFDEEKAAQ